MMFDYFTHSLYTVLTHNGDANLKIKITYQQAEQRESKQVI